MLSRYLSHIEFAWPWMLWLLVVVPLLLWQLYRGQKRNMAYRTDALPPPFAEASPRVRLRRLPGLLRTAAIACLIVAAARPVQRITTEVPQGTGLDIVLCLDISGSMLARDFSPNRLQAAIRVATAFVENRPGDRIGVVIFSGQSFTLCPLTTDHSAVLYQLQQIQYGLLPDGTSIGSGLASAVERLRLSTNPAKVVVLLTDGEDTGGIMDPDTALKLAQTFGVKIYTIGVGSEGYAKVPFQTATGTTVLEEEKVSIDEKLLQHMAQSTGGAYFRATKTDMLEDIYTRIDQLEKTDVQVEIFSTTREKMLPWVLAALLLSAIGFLLRHTWLRRIV